MVGAAATGLTRVSLTRMARPYVYPPMPPGELPPARTVVVPGRGEFFLRDTDPTAAADDDRPVVLLLHGWLVSADLNWHAAYEPLHRAGYRVLALDHRGHGRGLRPLVPFRLVDCAADAAALLRTLGLGPATVVGYSMGGTIAQLIARDHRDVVSGLVLSGTCQHFQDPETQRAWKWMGAAGVAMGLAPQRFFAAGLRRQGLPQNEHAAWLLSELKRHNPKDTAEAGRELGRFDSRPWLSSLRLPAAVVLTSRDSAVSPAKQRELADAIGATVFEVALDHLQLTSRPDDYNPALIDAVAAVTPERAAVTS
jgi:pimeloyl-ACP methyl ester carboxylesterase